MIPKVVVSLLQHLKDSTDLRVTIEIKGGRVVTPLSSLRSCERASPPRRVQSH
jgi:hypothetical protein